MSKILLPGNGPEAGRIWTEFSDLKVNVLDKIEIGNFTLSNFGNDFNPNSNKDRYAAHYSIPNPWASAFLFHYVLPIHPHPLHNDIITLMLNLLYDIYKNQNLKIIGLTKPEPDSPFAPFWEMAPEFIITENEKRQLIYLFEDSRTGKIIGGISNSTLVWVTQEFQPFLAINELLSNGDLANLMDFIKKKRFPIAGYNDFWAIKDLNDLVSKCRKEIPLNNPLFDSDITWLPLFKHGDDFADKHRLNDTLIIDDTIWDDDNIFRKLFNIDKIDEYKELLEKDQKGTALPMGRGDIKWLLYKSLFNESWIKMDAVYNDDREKMFYNDRFLFPLKPEYVEVGFDFNSINIDEKVQEAGDQAVVYFTQKDPKSPEKSFVHKTPGKVVRDERSVAIWPPFPSKIIQTHIFEYNLPGLGDLGETEFYSENGKQLLSEIIRKDTEENLRIYRLKEKGVFPHYIQLNIKGHTGLVKIILREKQRGQVESINVGLDFGSTHTTVAFSIDENEPELMTFKKSGPIVLKIGEAAPLAGFIPENIFDVPPITKKEFDNIYSNWSPFRTYWKPNDSEDNEFLSSGYIPLAGTPSQLTFISKKENIQYEQNIKWDASSKVRNGFLTHILNMILTECEAHNTKKVTIRWSYPRSFSQEEGNNMVAFYESFQEKLGKVEGLNIKVESYGNSEAERTLKYFVKKKKLTKQWLVATVDIGGGTTDLAFIQGEGVQFEDSVKFGGDDLTRGNLIELEQFLVEKVTGNQSDNEGIGFSSLLRTWPGVDKQWDGHLSDFLNISTADKLDRLGKFYHKIALFYGGICYYIGMHMRRINKKDGLYQIALAGFGSQFLKICSGGTALSENTISDWIDFFKLMVSCGHDIPKSEYEKTTFIFTDDPKKEVAFGLSYLQGDTPEVLTQKLHRMIGLDTTILGDEKEIRWSEWSDDKSSAIAHNSKIDFTIFENFISVFYKSIADAPEDTSLKRIQLQEGFPESEGIRGIVENEVRSEWENRENKPMASPLFFSAVKAWIQHINNL